MKTEVEIRIAPDYIGDEDYILAAAAKKCKTPVSRLSKIKIIKKSIDARKSSIVFQLRILVYIDESSEQKIEAFGYLDVSSALKVIIIGAGPAGYFAALKCLELGLKPVVVDRGKDVRSRRKDLRSIQQFGIVDPDSNYCYGEGGAGTYSDGKLYTRSHKRGKIADVLQILVDHGANKDILIDAHPHIGSNKLPGIISEIRNTIESNGGEVHFNVNIEEIEIRDEKVVGVVSKDGQRFDGQAYILATGHSARDIYHLFERKELSLESKPFALGVRVEHPQALIDQIQYGQNPRHENLPAASYKLVAQVEKKGVFSFCMCPGGLIVPAATSPKEIVVNGMSLSKRDSKYANSGLVTEVGAEELEQQGYKGIFAGIEFQSAVEQTMFNAGDGTQKAPAQRLTDFLKRKSSTTLASSSYIPGLLPADVHSLLPKFVYDRLLGGIKEFDRKMKGFHTAEANIVAVESRTSSPIRIPRDKEQLNHPQLSNLYPCGEGAGYAGGILSAALDGRNVAVAISKSVYTS